MQYLRAHGNTPGPTQRPLLTGAVSGLLAAIPFAVLLYYSGALASIGSGYSIRIWLVLCVNAGLMILAGMLYAAVFKRAANDCKGGWLFGISYGFLIWMAAPVTLWQLVTSQPIVIGRAAMGLFGAHLLYGLALGTVYPYIHWLLQTSLSDAPERQTFPGTFKNTGKIGPET